MNLFATRSSPLQLRRSVEASSGGRSGGPSGSRGGKRCGVRAVVSLGCGQPAAAASSVQPGGGGGWRGGMSGLAGSVAGQWSAATDLLAGLFSLMTDTDMTHEQVGRRTEVAICIAVSMATGEGM